MLCIASMVRASCAQKVEGALDSLGCFNVGWGSAVVENQDRLDFWKREKVLLMFINTLLIWFHLYNLWKVNHLVSSAVLSINKSFNILPTTSSSTSTLTQEFPTSAFHVAFSLALRHLLTKSWSCFGRESNLDFL